MKAFFEVRTPFFRPLWRRVVTVLLVAGWSGVELWLGNPYWAAVFGAAALYLVWAFFVAFDKGPGGGDDP